MICYFSQQKGGFCYFADDNSLYPYGINLDKIFTHHIQNV